MSNRSSTRISGLLRSTKPSSTSSSITIYSTNTILLQYSRVFLDLICFGTMNKRTNETIGSSTAGFTPAVSSEAILQQNERKNLFAEPISAASTDHPSVTTGELCTRKTSCFTLRRCCLWPRRRTSKPRPSAGSKDFCRTVAQLNKFG
jgi:hypothetical protein